MLFFKRKRFAKVCLLIMSPILVLPFFLTDAKSAGDYSINVLDSEIVAGETFRTEIKNNTKDTIKYTIKVNDFKTKKFLLKNAGTIKGNSSIKIGTTVTTAGKHTAEISIINPTNSKVLATEKPEINVTGTSKEEEKSEEDYESGGEGQAIETGVQIPYSDTKEHTYRTYICAVYKWAINIGFSLTFLMMIISGYIYMTSAGNEARFNMTKDILTSSILGFILLLLIHLVLNVLNLPYTCSGNGEESETVSMLVGKNNEIL